MRGTLAAVFVALWVGLAAGCLPAPEHRCAADGDCAGGVCVAPPGACAFTDGTCAGGLRFGAGAGALASTCVAAAEPDAAVTDAPPPPIDGPVGPDEDHDGVGDVADNCPHVANPLQEDAGEQQAGQPDGVGDACDPEPQRPGNAIALFDGFNGPLIGWNTSGSASAFGGRLRLGGTGAVRSAAIHPRYVEVVVAGRALGSIEQVSIVLGAAVPSAGTGTGLTVTQVAGGNPRLRLAYDDVAVNESSSMAINGAADFVMSLAAGRSQWSGQVSIEGGLPLTVRRISMASLANGRITLGGGGGATFELDYVAVITLAEL